jgi:hypothetical protein
MAPSQEVNLQNTIEEFGSKDFDVRDRMLM